MKISFGQMEALIMSIICVDGNVAHVNISRHTGLNQNEILRVTVHRECVFATDITFNNRRRFTTNLMDDSCFCDWSKKLWIQAGQQFISMPDSVVGSLTNSHTKSLQWRQLCIKVCALMRLWRRWQSNRSSVYQHHWRCFSTLSWRAFPKS